MASFPLHHGQVILGSPFGHGVVIQRRLERLKSSDAANAEAADELFEMLDRG